MVANLTNPRPDIIFMRRRLKIGEEMPVIIQPDTSSLILNRTPLESSEETLPVKKDDSNIPYANGIVPLVGEHSAYRLNTRQSAIGTLMISNAIVVGWQLNDGSSGYLYNDGVDSLEGPAHQTKTHMNRPIVEFQKELLIVGLRSIKDLKRLIIVPEQSKTMQAEVISGAGVFMEFEPFTVLYLSVVNSELEFRKEKFKNTLTKTFNLQKVELSSKPVSNHLTTLFSVP